MGGRRTVGASLAALAGLMLGGCDGGEGTGPCEPDPCVHGTCSAAGGEALCACDPGWSGELCDRAEGCGGLTAIAPLEVSLEGTAPGDRATYRCAEGWTLLGEESRRCTDSGWDGEEPLCLPGPCADHECEHDAACVEDGEDGYRCECLPGFEGERCETNIDDCEPDPCLNGGTCIDGVAGFVCDCSTAPGWQGDLCDEDFPDCASEPCVHGTCVEGEPGSGELSCECPPGWTGDLCEVATDPCTPNPCRHGGACTTGEDGGFSCECPAGYAGERCETNVDDCDPDPCLNGGTCIDGVDSFTCTCPPGFSGLRCETVVASCADAPCIHATGCTDTGPGTYTCHCEAGWEGVNCELNVDDCDPDPCANGGTCVDGVAGFTCDCSTAPGWEGTTCDTMTDLCTPNPCLNGGSCSMESAGVYRCACVDGYSGSHCATPPATTECILTYELVVGNGNNSTGYTGSNMRIRDTFLGLGNGTHAVGPGVLVLRVPSDGGSSPAPGAAVIYYYELTVEFVTSTAGITITTDIDAFSPVLGAVDNSVAQASGTLTLGATPTIAWGGCSFPAGYNDTPTSYTPDVVGTGPGCLAPYRSVGVVNCHDASAFASCASGGLSDGDNPQDETWEQALQTLTFTTGLASFQMPFALVPNRSDSRTYLSWGGTLASTVCR